MSNQIRSSIETLGWESLLNRGMQYGDGLFETMRVVNGRIPLWAFHWQRLVSSAKTLQLNLPDESVFLSHISKWSWQSPQSVIKLMLFRKSSGRGYLATHSTSDWILQAAPLPEIKKEPSSLGVAQLKLAEQPMLAGLKHLNRLEQVLLAKELFVSNFDEMLVCSQSGKVVEAVSQNLIFVKDEVLFTPDVSLCGVCGVGVAWLKKYFDIKDDDVDLEELMTFDELYLINSVRGITQVMSVDGVKKFSTNSPLHDRINRLWNELMTS